MRWKHQIAKGMIAVLLMVGVLGAFGAVASAEPSPQNSVRISDAEGHPGDTVVASVYLTPKDMINKYDVTISYDSNSLELEPGNEVTNDLGVSDDGDSFAAEFSTPGSVNVQANLVDYVILMDDTKAFTLHFKIKDTAQAGEQSLEVTKHDLYEGDPSPSTFTIVTAGKINVIVNTHSVTFDSQGGSAVDGIAQASDGGTIGEPASPSRDGYSFEGWYTDAAGTGAWNFTADPVTSDLTLYAKWTRNAANVGIGSESGTQGSTVIVPVAVSSSSYGIGAYGMQIDYDPEALEVLSITGEAGDYFDSNFNNDAGWLKAVWADSDGGDTPIAAGEKLFSISFKINSDATLGDKPLTVQTGDASRFSFSDTQAIEMEKTLTPGKVTVSEQPTLYTVTFDSRGGSAVSAVTASDGAIIDEPTAPTKSGYTFAGWYKDAAGTNAWSFATDTVAANVTLYAKWTQVPASSYTVTFDSRGGSAVSAVTASDGAIIDEPTAPTKSGYTFAGWYKDAAGTNAWSFATDTVAANVTLYAKWTQVPASSYTVTFDSRGGSAVSAVTASDGAIIDEPTAPTKSGYTFAGWYKDAAGTNAWSFATDTVAANVTLYAKWTQVPASSYTVTFDSRGGSAVSAVTASDGAIIDEPTAPTKSGYTFAGWYKDAAGTNAWSFATDTVAANVTLYAKWTQVPASSYTVTFDSRGGSAVSAVTASDGAIIDEPTAPTKSGYTFAGWYKDAAGTNAWSFATDAVAANVTLYAKWTSNAPIVTVPSSSNSSTSDGLQVIVDGVAKDQIAKGVIAKNNGKNVLTATVDPNKLIEQLSQATDKSSVVIPVTSNVEKVSVVLTGDLVKSMETKQVVLEVRTPNGSYKLPAQQIAIDDVSSKLGTQVGLSDIVVHVDIAKSDEATKDLAETVAAQGNYSIVVAPVQFSVTADYNGTTVNVEQFSSYVEREIPLPADLDPSKVTTAAVVNSDGTVRHVPTFITARDGKYYAVVNSLTNSDYSLIWNPQTFADVSGHWSESAVNDMASRMIVKGMDEEHFKPNSSITRAEFAAIAVRSLGLADNGGDKAFTDVKSGDWYAGAIATAAEYGLIEGNTDGTFNPGRTITRQEALVIMARAMKLAGMETTASDAESRLSPFADRTAVAAWAKSSVAAAVMNGLVEGTPEGLEPAGSLTRAETAAIVERFLIKAGLIDNGEATQG